jgi:hypothetical protein
VGTGVILYAYRLGAQIVAISDAEGIIYDSEGIDVEQLLSRRAISTADLSDEDRTGALKLLSPFADECPDHDYSVVTEREVSLNGHFRNLGVDPKLGHMLQHALAVNVFVPAASRYLLNCRAIDIASEGMWKDTYPRLVVTGANNPFGTHDELGLPKAPNTEDRDAIGRCLRDRGIVYVPDFRSNGGTAQLFHCYASGELDWVLDETTVGAPVLPFDGQERVLQIVTGRIVDAVNKDLGNSDSSLLDLAARAEQRVAVQTAACQ